MPSNLAGPNAAAPQIDSRSRPNVEHRGLGDFQSRLNKGYNREDQNRPRDRGYEGRDARQQPPGRGRNWDEGATPRSTRSNRDDGFGGSMRIPNMAWDETPRAGRREEGGGDSGARNRNWDAATPRSVRGSQRDDSPGADGDGLYVDPREWEEEQIRLDRDWYASFDEGGVVSPNCCFNIPCRLTVFTVASQVGDEEHNPFAGYEDLGRAQEKEMAVKQVKRMTAKQAQYVRLCFFDWMQSANLVSRRTKKSICGR